VPPGTLIAIMLFVVFFHIEKRSKQQMLSVSHHGSSMLLVFGRGYYRGRKGFLLFPQLTTALLTPKLVAVLPRRQLWRWHSLKIQGYKLFACDTTQDKHSFFILTRRG